MHIRTAFRTAGHQAALDPVGGVLGAAEVP